MLWTSLSGLPLLCPIGFGFLWVHFRLFPKLFDFFPNLILHPFIVYSMLFNFHVFECFGVFSLRFVSSFSPLWSEQMFIWYQFSWTYWGLFCVLSCGLSLKMFHVHLKRMCTLLLWDERYCIYLLSPFDLWHCSMLDILVDTWFGWSIPFWQWGVKIPWHYCLYLSWNPPKLFLHIWVLLCWVHVFL